MALVPVDSTYGALVELEDIGKSDESLARLVESQKELFHSQIDQFQKIVVTQRKLTGANPLAQEMAAGALSIKIGKRPRDLLNPKSVKYMQSIFSIKDTIGKKETREISALCGITVTQVRDYFSSQRSRVRKIVRLSHEQATTTTDGRAISPNQSVPASKDMPVSTSEVVGDCARNSVNSENITSVYTQYPATPENAFPIGTQFSGNPSSFSSVCFQIPQSSGNVTTVCTQVPGYSGSITSVCTQVPGNLVNATPISMLAPGNSGNLTTVFTPILGYPGIVTAVGTLVSGSFMNIAPIQDGQLGPIKTNPKPVEEGPSCSLQEETTPGVDSDDKKFLENIFNLMRKEQTFSGWVKLMEWVLQIHNSAVLSWFSTKGGITILAKWLSEAATEEQITVLLVIFKVLCHLPLSKAQPVHMSAILQTVNRLRFYRSSDISNRAKVLLSRWSKMFVRSQALSNSRNSLKNGQKEMIHKQRANEVLGDESWETKLDIPDEILALAESAEDSRETEPKKALKLLTDSIDGSVQKHSRSVSATKTNERRKVLLVEQPDSKAGRSTPAARAVPSNHSRPMSADDIQKAKMRSIHMQDKYGKSNASASEYSSSKAEAAPVSQVPADKLPQPRRNEVKKSPPVPTTRSLSDKPEISSSSNPKPNLTTQEQLLEKLMKYQIQWRMPPEVRMNSSWRVGAGENSREAQVQTQRNRREKETFYPRPEDIPPNPKEPWDVEMDFDDSLTPEIPIEQPPDLESPIATTEAPLSSPTDGRAAASVAPVVTDSSSTSSAVVTETVLPPPVTTGNAVPEPDTELLMVLLKNPDIVDALTKGEGRNLAEEQLVALLDVVKKAGTGVTGILDGLAYSSGARPRDQPEPESFSLPSPTPPSNATGTGWRSEFPSHASTSASPPQFSSNHRGGPVIPTVNPPTPLLPVMPMGVNNHIRLQSQLQLTVTTNPPPQHHQPVPNLLPAKLPPMYPPVQQSRGPETIIPSNHYPVNHPSLQPLRPGPMKPPPVHSELAVFHPKTLAWLPADTTALMPEYTNGVLDDPATNSSYYAANHNDYNHNSHNMYPRNEYVPRPEMGRWSPEESPAEFREFQYDRWEFDQGNEWSTQRQWSSGRRRHSQYWGGGRGGDRRWRDRDRGR